MSERLNKINDKFDFIIFLPALFLSIIGLIAIYSATHNHPTAYGNFQKQFYSLIIALISFSLAYFIPYKFYKTIALPAFVLTNIFLVLVLFFGKTVYGSKSWLSFGQFGFQPSEFGKIGLILFLAYFLTKNRRPQKKLFNTSIILSFGFIPILLILAEPDMGTAIVYALLITVMIFWSGIELFGFFVFLSPAFVVFASLFGKSAFFISMIVVIIVLFYFKRNIFLSASVVVINLATAFLFDYGIKYLQPHQQKRIQTFVNPLADPLGAGYNILQTKVAIGSGGIVGKGFLEGNQTQLRFIPEQWTDFIFCVIGEEFGFIGSIFVIILFLIIFLRLINIASHSKDRFDSLVIIGTLALLFSHFAINIGMNIGIAPVIGLPLPFLSFGGSSIIVNMFLLGVVINFYKNRREHV